MLTQEIFTKLAITPKDLRKKFDAGRKKKKGDKIESLVQLLRDRVDEGRRQNLTDYRLWWAMDVAYDVPFRQTTTSMLSSLMERMGRNDLSSEQTKETFNQWGLAHLVKTTKNEDGKTCHNVDLPVMFNIHLPLARAYLNIRWAKLYSDRNVFPFLKYEPIKYTIKNRLRCEIITDTIELQAQQFGYRSTFKQWLFNALHYGTAIMFPMEDWYKEKTHVMDDKGVVKVKTKKQGLRYNIPHPSRTFYDQAHRIGTINYDSGVTFAGYWRIGRYRDVMKNPNYWNKEYVTMMSNDLIRGNPVYFSTVYPCQMEFANVSGAAATTGAGQLDRESAVSYYTSAHEDKAVVMTDLFCKLIPKQWDLADTECPIWFRFVLCNDDDVIYAAPLTYTPPLYIGYDAHEERRRNASLTLEVMPFQDHMSNLITQQILLTKQNLARVVFVNQDLVPPQYLKKIENLGEDLYRSITFIPYKGKVTQMMQSDIRQAFTNVQFPMASSVELMSTFRLLLDILERILVFSAQEVGAVASHEQTAEEARIVAGNVNSRIELTNSFIEDGIYAWKKQLYDALMGYGDKEIVAQVPSVPTITPKTMDDIGFNVVEVGVPGQAKMQVKGPKKALAMEDFASSREGENRINNPEVAASMAQVMSVMMANPMTMMAIGAEQAIEIYNMIIRIAGMPREFKLNVTNAEAVANIVKQQSGLGQKEQAAQMQEMFGKLAEEILNRAGEQSIQITQQAMQPIQGEHQQLVDAVTQIADRITPLEQGMQQVVDKMNAILKAAASQSGTQQTPP